MTFSQNKIFTIEERIMSKIYLAKITNRNENHLVVSGKAVRGEDFLILVLVLRNDDVFG